MLIHPPHYPSYYEYESSLKCNVGDRAIAATISTDRVLNPSPNRPYTPDRIYVHLIGFDLIYATKPTNL